MDLNQNVGGHLSTQWPDFWCAPQAAMARAFPAPPPAMSAQAILLGQDVPDVLDAETLPPEVAGRWYLCDPTSRRELGFVKSADLRDGTVEFYRTVDCRPGHPQCVRYDGRCVGRRFAERVQDVAGWRPRATYRKRRDFDVVDRESGAIVRRVRTS